jgi:hypothetical protein
VEAMTSVEQLAAWVNEIATAERIEDLSFTKEP